MLRPSVAVLRPSVVVLRPDVAVLCPGVAVLRSPAQPPNAPPQHPRSTLANRAQEQFANRPCCAAAAWHLMHSMLANPPSTYG